MHDALHTKFQAVHVHSYPMVYNRSRCRLFSSIFAKHIPTDLQATYHTHQIEIVKIIIFKQTYPTLIWIFHFDGKQLFNALKALHDFK